MGVQVPLAMLYLTKYFPQEIEFREMKFAKELLRGEKLSFFANNEIYYAYKRANYLVMNVFKKWFEF